jgi:Endonuclease/Exonuclease/phosphatase family
MSHLNRTLIIGLAITTFGCAPDSTTVPSSAMMQGTSEADAALHGQGGLVVMSQNMYVGADVDAVIGALASPDPNDDLPTLITQIGILQETDFPTRAAAFADAIARHRPHVVGLMEVSTIDIDLTPLGLNVVYHMDFLSELNQALASRHLQYRVAGVETNFTASPLPGISLVDRDVLLVDAHRVRVGDGVVARTYSTNLGPVAPGVSLARGFVSVPIEVEGRRYRVSSTHLESDLAGNNLGLLRSAQMQELITVIGSAERAVILGDLNDFAGSPMYQMLVRAGYTDVWATLLPGTDGFTCCHATNLTNDRIPDQRIDYVFTRGLGGRRELDDGLIRRIGFWPGEMVPGPLHPIWASDHAGLVARLDPK